MKHAAHAAKLSKEVYERDYADGSSNVVLGKDERAIVEVVNRQVFVSFRGTVTKSQWISNADIKKIDGMHRGFSNGLGYIFDDLFAWVEEFDSHSYEFVICGHSRGAAMAAIFAEALMLTGIPVVEVHLFGCPRVFSKRMARRYNDLLSGVTWRWVANNDAVCRLPFAWMGFRHVGNEMYFDPFDDLIPAPSFWQKASGQIKGRIHGGLFDGISDHDAAKEYARLLRR